MTKNNHELLAETAQLASVLILKSGGETFRAEETAVRICEAGGIADPDVLALPTGIFISIATEGEPTLTSVKRLKSSNVNLYKLENSNFLARSYNNGSITLEELNRSLHELNSAKLPSKLMTVLASAFSAAMFTLLLEDAFSFSAVFDCVISFICGLIVQYISSSIKISGIYQFATSFIGGLIIALTAVSSTALSGIGNVGSIIIGAMTPLLPGLSLTNAIRDTVMGDLVSGVARFAEALLIAVALAASVGVVFSAYISLGGVI